MPCLLEILVIFAVWLRGLGRQLVTAHAAMLLARFWPVTLAACHTPLTVSCLLTKLSSKGEKGPPKIIF